jgi:hypothetical protein
MNFHQLPETTHDALAPEQRGPKLASKPRFCDYIDRDDTLTRPPNQTKVYASNKTFCS